MEARVDLGRFVGVGVDEYSAQSLRRLEHAVEDVREFRRLLGGAFVGDPLLNPTEDEVRELLGEVKGSMPEPGALVLLWAGHAVRSMTVRLRLLARNSDPAKDQGFDVIGDVGSAGALSGANQLLFIIDTCFSGEAVSAAEVVAAVLQGQPPDASRLWVGVLASCLSVETARDGLLGRKMRELLERGPEDPLLRVRWSRHNEFLRGDDLCDAVLKEWDSEVQAPQFQANGNAWWMFRNPLYDADAPEQVVEHLLRAARGGAHVGERSWFTGRTEEVNQVVGWVRDGRPGVHVVMGSAGTGKSAIVGRVVSLSNPQERARLLNEGGWDHADPGERAVSAHVHVRGLTADRAADLLGEQLVRCGLLAAQEQRRNASELVGQVQRVVDGGCRAPVVVLDGLDEARGEAFSIAEELLVRLGRHAVVVVSTRELRRGDERPSLVRTLAPDTDALDLDDPAVQERGRGDLRDYVAARLAGVSDRMDSGKVAEHLAEVTSMSQQRPFLLARLVADQLLEKPVDTSSDDWRKRVSRTIEEAFENDLRSVEPRPNDALEGVEASDAARALLGALTWGLGAGLPEDEWLAIARCTSGVTVDREDVAWVLDQLGRFIVQDSEAGVAVYRLAHQSLADYLRAPYHADYEHPFDPDALPIAATLLDRYKVLLEGGVAVEAPGYLWRYAWRHTALAGPDGLQVLRALSQRERGLASDVAAAAIEIAGVLRQWGHRQDALAPTEEAVTLYRELAAQNPAFLPNLAMALNKLGNRYAEVGRRGDALAPTEEAVTLRRELAAQNPAFLPNLADALTSFNDRCIAVGQSDRANDAWQSAQIGLNSMSRGTLLIARAAAASEGDPNAVGWLSSALILINGERGLATRLHDQARRHRDADPAGFDSTWESSGREPSPPWLTVNAELLESARAWIGTSTYEEERAYLAAHPQLLESDADVAIEEALLGVSEEAAERYVNLRARARSDGVDGAYKPLLSDVLARQFVVADPQTQRRMLAERRSEVLDEAVRSAVKSMRGDERDALTQRAAALLELAAHDQEGPVLDAIDEPSRFSSLLLQVALHADIEPLEPTAIIAYTSATSDAQAADAAFFMAVAAAETDRDDDASEWLNHARTFDPQRVTSWISQLAQIAQRHPVVVPLITELTTPPGSPDPATGE
ncbi:MAG: AAA family ATPase [Solirubrobacteraceae bacterium]